MAVTLVSPPTTRPHKKKTVLCCDGSGIDIAFRWMLDQIGVLPGADGKYRDGPGILLNKPHLDLVLGKMPIPAVDSELLYIPPTCSKLHNSLTGMWWPIELLPHLHYGKDNGKEQRISLLHYLHWIRHF